VSDLTSTAFAVLDGPRIAAARLATGMAEKAIYATTGISPQTLRAIEAQDGGRRTAAAVSLNQLRLLAEALAIPVAALFTTEDHREPDHPNDARELTALVQHAAKPVLPELLAHALGWELRRVNRTTEELVRSLPLVGLRLHRNSTGQLALMSALDHNGAAARALERLTLDNRSLNRTEAQLVTIAHDRGLPRKEVNDAVKRIALGHLVKQGILVSAYPDVRLDPVVKYALEF